MSITQEQVTALVQAAQKVRRYAYAPFSQFTVGAAVMDDSGRIYSGCNIENASFGLTVCAERVALFSAVAQGQRQFLGHGLGDTGGTCSLWCLPPGPSGILSRSADLAGGFREFHARAGDVASNALAAAV